MEQYLVISPYPTKSCKTLKKANKRTRKLFKKYRDMFVEDVHCIHVTENDFSDMIWNSLDRKWEHYNA